MRARAFEPFPQHVRALNELLSLATYYKSLEMVQKRMITRSMFHKGRLIRDVRQIFEKFKGWAWAFLTKIRDAN